MFASGANKQTFAWLFMNYCITGFLKWKLRFPGASNKLSDWVVEWVSDRVCSFSTGASSAMEAGKETKFGTEVAYEMPECQIHAAQRKCAIPHSTMKTHHYVTYVVVTAVWSFRFTPQSWPVTFLSLSGLVVICLKWKSELEVLSKLLSAITLS